MERVVYFIILFDKRGIEALLSGGFVGSCGRRFRA